MSGTAQAQSIFDKGLRGPPPEQLATVSKLSSLFEENPAPTFVNSMLLRVADAFKDGSLDLRVAISRALGQCGSHLTLAFSSAEIFRRILTVSHSNDPNARETVLDVLAVLSPLLPESHQSHHLIRESLSTEHEGEFRAACHALQSFAAISQSFAESIVLQIGKVLEEDDVSDTRKVQLCPVFSTMSATAQVVEQVFGVAENVLRRTTTDEFFHAFLHATTSLCIEVRYAIPKQIDLLLALLNPLEKEKRRPSKTRKLIILKKLRRLADFSNIWTDKQVKTFVSTLNPSMTDRCLADFFDATVLLAKNCPHANLLALKSLVISSTGYGSVVNPEVSVRFAHLAAQVVCSPRAFEDDTPEFVEATMTSLTVVVVNACTCGKLKTRLASRLFRAVGDLLIKFPFSDYPFSPMIISAVFSAFESAPFDNNNQKERLELLCRLADSDKLYISEIHKWACGVLRERKTLFTAYPSQFAYLCLAVGTELPEEIAAVLLKGSALQLYETARSALRNGHWKRIASENLQKIDMISMSQTKRDWLTALRELAKSELSELSFNALESQQNHLINALSVMKTSRTNPSMENTLRFPIGMVNAMLSTSYAYFHVLSVIEPFTTYLSEALQPNSFFNPIVAKRFLTAISACESSVNEALTEWSALCRASFCADATSSDLITLYYLRASILLEAIRVVLRKQSADIVIQIPPLTDARTCSIFQRERLQWSIDKITYLRYESVPNIKTVNALLAITEQLAVIPYMLPRFFFQQFYHVDVKITTTPQAEKEKPVSVMSGETIPVRVDGSISSTHTSEIRSIIVYADIIYISSHAHNHTLREIVDANENNYFTAQFLLSFRAPCEVKFRIEFVDQTSRKQWKADGGTTTLPIVVREVAPMGGHPDLKRPPPMPFMRSSVYHSDL